MDSQTQSAHFEVQNPTDVDQLSDAKPNANTGTAPSQPILKRHFLSFHGPYFGILCAVFAATFTVLTSVVTKKVTHFNAGQQDLMIHACITVGSLPIVVFTGQTNLLGPKELRASALLRAVLSATPVYFSIMAYRHLPLSEMAIIFSTLPAVATVLARLFLKEPCGIVQSVCLVLSIVGALLAVRVPVLMSNRTEVRFTTDYVTGLASCIGSVVCFSFAFLLMRVTRESHFSLQMLHWGLVGTVISAVLTATVDVELPNCGGDSSLMAAAGLTSFLCYCFITLAMQTEAVSIVTIIRASSEVAIALVFQVIFFNEYIDAYNASGAILVIASMSGLGVNKWLRQLPQGSSTKKKFSFLLL